jgi:hypothetical protein
MLTPDDIGRLEQTVEADEAEAATLRREIAETEAAIAVERVALGEARGADTLPDRLFLVAALGGLLVAILLVLLVSQTPLWCR